MVDFCMWAIQLEFQLYQKESQYIGLQLAEG